MNRRQAELAALFQKGGRSVAQTLTDLIIN